MKILHVLNSNSYSGAENVVCQIIEMFKNDENIEMAYCSRDGQIKNVLQSKNIKFYPISGLNKNELKKVVADFKPDIIHAHDFRASIVCSGFSKKTDVISHLHNNSPWLKKFCLKSIVYGLSCKRYKKILTVSDSVFDEFIFGERFKSKLTRIGNPVNIEAIREKSNEYVYEKHYDICVCGRLTAPKNPFGMLEILNRLTVDFSAALIGDGELRDDVVKKINELKLNDKIELLGFRDNPYPIIKNCKLLLMPSAWEGFGLAAVEALALGLPVVCSNVGGLPAIVNDECGKVCEAENQYAEEIDKLLLDSEYLKKKRAAANVRAGILDNYDKYKSVLKTLYCEVK